MQERFPGHRDPDPPRPRGPHRPRDHAAVRPDRRKPHDHASHSSRSMPSPSGRSTGNPAAVMPLDALARRRADAGDRGREQPQRDRLHRARRTATTPTMSCAGSRRPSRSTCAAMRRSPPAHILLTGETVRFATRSGILTVAARRRLARARPAGAAQLSRGRRARAVRRAWPSPARRSGSAAEVQRQRDRPARRSKPRSARVTPDFAALAGIRRTGHRHRAGRRAGRRQPGVRALPRHRRGPGDRLGPRRAGAVLGRSGSAATDFTALQASARDRRPALPAARRPVILGGHCLTVIAGNFQL